MNFNEAYNYLLSFNNLPRQEFLGNKKKDKNFLNRIKFFLKLLDNPEKSIKNYIHVTGTSGKGSVVNFLHNILQTNFTTVGSSYSPHHTCITERWKVNNKNMTKKEFTDIIEFLKPKFDEYLKKSSYEMPSFFEITEIIAFIFFKNKKVDYAVLEVGCGGRYDSSNVIPHKKIAVITNIGLDHVGLIGNNEKEITYEKSGIINTVCEVFTAEENKKNLNIIKKECQKSQANLNIVLTNKFKILQTSLDSTIFNYQKENYKIKTIGQHQIINAILCIEIAKKLKIDSKKIKLGLVRTFQSLRLEIIKKEPLIILDGAHNKDKMNSTVESILKLNKKVNLIIGFSGDKDIDSQIKSLMRLNLKTMILTRNTNNLFRKVADPKNLERKIKKLNKKIACQLFLDPKDAYNFAKNKTKKNEILLVTGSIFLSGEIKKFII